MEKEQTNPFSNTFESIGIEELKEYKFVNLSKLEDKRVNKLPYSIRILLEQAVRNCDNFSIKKEDIEKILDWNITSNQDVEIPFKPARVLLQDYTGVPAVVDLASMRDVVVKLGKNPELINPKIPTELVIDHSIQVDSFGQKDSLQKNEEMEFYRNKERFQFLKWGQKNIKNFLIVPPGSGIVHQVNLEYLARCVFKNTEEKLIYPDSLIGTDSHTTMINGLGVLGWGVGGIEAEAAMLGQTISMVLPQVVGVKITNKMSKICTATDLVLTITEILRKRGVVGKFVEFFGEGCESLSLADRATIANMSPEYGATMGYFAIDNITLEYMRITGRSEEQINLIEKYAKANKIFREYNNSNKDDEICYSGEIVHVDLSKIVPCLAGPKRPQDRVDVVQLKQQFLSGLTDKVSFKGFGLSQEKATQVKTFTYNNVNYELKNGSIVIAAITSCTNTSNPDVMIAAGIIAQKAVNLGLKVPEYIKTSLSPGSGVVTKYLENSNLLESLEKLGFCISGYGCMTCIGNSGELPDLITELVTSSEIVVASVLSGNRNFEGRVHNLVKANYLASPPLVVAYALAGKVDIDFENERIGVSSEGKDVFLTDIWPSKEEIFDLVTKTITPKLFSEVYTKISKGTDNWNNLEVSESLQYKWDKDSTYIKEAPFFNEMFEEKKQIIQPIKSARVLLYLGDSITTDHISPAGNIAKDSAAAKYLIDKNVTKKDFNTYGARRGNYEVMARGTFGNVRIINKLLSEVGSKTKHFPSGEVLDIFSVSSKYKQEKVNLIILAGKEYGSGSSRDWAAKGPVLLGVNAVIAESYERIHRSNLAGMGILPLEFLEGENADKFGIKGDEVFEIHLEEVLSSGMIVKVSTDTGIKFDTKLRLDTAPEIEYYKCSGILQYVLRGLN